MPEQGNHTHKCNTKYPNITLEQLLDTQAFQEYVQTLLQTLDSIQVHQPKRFLPLAKEAQKLAEAPKKEQDAAQRAGICPEKILQESFVKRLNAIQALDQLAPQYPAREHLPQDIITILELLGKLIIFVSTRFLI